MNLKDLVVKIELECYENFHELGISLRINPLVTHVAKAKVNNYLKRWGFKI